MAMARTFAAADDRLRRWIARHRRVFALTGAGCSTASGIPDYRDDQGEWKRRPPVMIQAFRTQAAVYRRYWARAYAGWPRFIAAAPNAAHRAFAAWEARRHAAPARHPERRRPAPARRQPRRRRPPRPPRRRRVSGLRRAHGPGGASGDDGRRQRGLAGGGSGRAGRRRRRRRRRHRLFRAATLPTMRRSPQARRGLLWRERAARIATRSRARRSTTPTPCSWRARRSWSTQATASRGSRTRRVFRSRS